MGQKILRMSRQFFNAMLETGERNYRVINGLPADAVMIGISDQFYFSTDEIAVKFESEEWPEITPGDAIPVMDLRIDTIQPTSQPTFTAYGYPVSPEVAKAMEASLAKDEQEPALAVVEAAKQLGQFYAEISKPKDEPASEPPVRFREFT